jgi:hypothetical protein
VILSNRSYNVKKPPSLQELREDVFIDAAGLDSTAAGTSEADGQTSAPAPATKHR